MADATLVTNENAVNRATVIQTPLTNARLRLLDSYIPQITDNRTVLLANEANFTGYPSGGYNISFAGPSLISGAGAWLNSNVATVAPAANNTLSANLSGWWVESSANTPQTLLTGVFNPTRTVTTPLDQFPLIITDVEGLAGSQPATT
jgi:hypothetical protein